MLSIKQSRPGTSYGDIMLPVGALYTTFKRSGTMPACIMWVERLPRYQGGISVTIMTTNDQHPHTEYFRWSSSITRAFYQYAQENCIAELHCKPQITHKQLACLAPHDREVGAYILRGRPEYNNCDHVLTDYEVIQNSHVGKNFYSAEGYRAMVMGCTTPDYNHK